MTPTTLREEFKKEFQAKCMKCGKPGVNPFGECICSYKTSLNTIEPADKIADWWLPKIEDLKSQIVRELEKSKQKHGCYNCDLGEHCVPVDEAIKIIQEI